MNVETSIESEVRVVSSFYHVAYHVAIWLIKTGEKLAIWGIQWIKEEIK